MAEVSTKPYLIRAIHEWCSDQGFTPYLAVSVDEHTRVPMEYVKSGEIVLNVSLPATSHLRLGNDWIEFQARFNGVVRDIAIPIHSVSAIYARETGHGMAFEVVKPLAENPRPRVEDDQRSARENKGQHGGRNISPLKKGASIRALPSAKGGGPQPSARAGGQRSLTSVPNLPPQESAPDSQQPPEPSVSLPLLAQETPPDDSTVHETRGASVSLRSNTPAGAKEDPPTPETPASRNSDARDATEPIGIDRGLDLPASGVAALELSIAEPITPDDAAPALSSPVDAPQVEALQDETAQLDMSSVEALAAERSRDESVAPETADFKEAMVRDSASDGAADGAAEEAAVEAQGAGAVSATLAPPAAVSVERPGDVPAADKVDFSHKVDSPGTADSSGTVDSLGTVDSSGTADSTETAVSSIADDSSTALDGAAAQQLPDGKDQGIETDPNAPEDGSGGDGPAGGDRAKPRLTRVK